ncbi:MAG: histone H1 [Bacteroidetes bacterium]|nr:histone H1 [Bacteroidota bacterium]
MKDIEKLKTLVKDANSDVQRFYGKGNKSAGVRVRKAMQEVKILAQSIRNDIAKTNQKRL